MTDSEARGSIADGCSVDEALRRAAAAARREYVRAGLSMPVWRIGRLMWIQPAELQRYDVVGQRNARSRARSARTPGL